MKSLWKSSFFPWFAVFALMNVFFTQNGGMNEASRFTTLHAMTMENRFTTDSCWQWSVDWAKTPDGHYYSNKAPGPMFVAYPFVWVAYHVFFALNGHNDFYNAHGPHGAFMGLVSYLFQVIPYMIVCWFALLWLEQMGIGLVARHFVALALLFGNTASVFMNLYFGHAMAAWMILGGVLALLEEHLFVAGLLCGFALLSDYGIAVFFPWVFVVLASRFQFSRWGRFLVGGVFPGILWIWYHTACFGSPFALPMKFQNPDFVDHTSTQLWGVLSPNIHWDILKKLLIGGSRGILVTQPWVFVTLACSVSIFKQNWRLACIAIGSFIFLLWMNSSFNGWHGGVSAGPRYLAIAFPVLALASGFAFDQCNANVRGIFWIALAAAVGLRVLIFSYSHPPGFEPIWPYYLHFVFGTGILRRASINVFMLVLALSTAGFVVRKKVSCAV